MISTNLPTFTLSEDQTNILHLVNKQIHVILSKNNDISFLDDYPQRFIIQGKAESGKSTIINEIVRRVKCILVNDAIITTSPTGSAAININGSTLHSAFKLPLRDHEFAKLEGKTARYFHKQYKNSFFLL